MWRINQIMLLLSLMLFLITESRTQRTGLFQSASYHMKMRRTAKYESEVWNICEAEFDAVSFVGNDLLIFIGQYMYSRELDTFMAIRNVSGVMFDNLTHIDAFFADTYSNEYIIVGQEIRKFSLLSTSGNGELVNLSMPTNLPANEQIESAFQYNGKHYLASAENYWRFDDEDGKQGPKVAQSLRDFEGAEALLPLTTAFTGRNGTTYFVKGKRYYPIDAKKKRVLTSAGRSTRDLICSAEEKFFVNQPSCCLEQPRRLVKEFGPRALFLRYGMRRLEVMDICKAQFDAIAVARNSLFMFIGKYMYSSARKEFMLISDAYPSLPENLTRIDAYLFLPDGTEYFYMGRDVHIIYNTETVPNVVVDLSHFLFYEELEHIDAIFHLDGHIIIIGDYQYWECDLTGKITTGPYYLHHFSWVPNLPVTTGFGEFEGNSYIVYGYKHMTPTSGKSAHHPVLNQRDLVCNPRVLEYQSPPTCCIK